MPGCSACRLEASATPSPKPSSNNATNSREAPLAFRGASQESADFSGWQLRLHPVVTEECALGNKKEELLSLASDTLLCCPEDHRCARGCAEQKLLCPACEIPLCKDCGFAMARNGIPAMGIINDNFCGYLQPWIYTSEITWMENAVATPFWTGMMLFSIDRRQPKRRKHNLLEKVYAHQGRVAFKGQMFSAPMDWRSTLEQLEHMEAAEAHVALPAMGAVLAARVRISIASGLVDLNRLLRQATVRRNVVVQLIRMRRDAGHPDYASLDMRQVELRARELTTTDDPAIPNGLADFLEGAEDDGAPFLGVDKAATPAERTHTEADLARDLERARPQTLTAQRDSDANKEVEHSRVGAFGQFSQLALRTGSTLVDQFKTPYIPRVFAMTFPWHVGGPDFPQQPRWRRRFEDAPRLSLHEFTAMIPARCEYQLRADWDMNPGRWSLSFATKVNLGVSMSIQRALRRGGEGEDVSHNIGGSTARIYKLLWDGEYSLFLN